MLNETVVGNYFNVFKITVTQEHSIKSIRDMDETGMNLEYQQAELLARSGVSSVIDRVGNTRECITNLPCGNAAVEINALKTA